MNILISTTTNWNPGDDFIRYGVKNLLTDYFKQDINWIHYDRNPDFFAPDEWKMGSGHKSNCMNSNIDFSVIDMVVLAGSPEFIHGPLCNLYDGLVNHPDIPLLAIGVGYSDPMENVKLTENEFKVLSRKNTLIITRQEDLQDKLLEILPDKIPIYCLPCPALFAAQYLEDDLYPRAGELFIPQVNFGNQAISEDDYKKIEIYEPDILCHYIEDFKEFGGYYSSEPLDLLKRIIQYQKITTCRLHGGIPALGKGSTVNFLNTSNRVQKALEPFAPYKKNYGYYMNSGDVFNIRNEYFFCLKQFFEMNK